MTETEEAPQEEPDTPIEELAKLEQTSTVVNTHADAMDLVRVRRQRQELEEVEEKLMERLLPEMRELGLHGIRLPDKAAVRRRWNPNRPTIDAIELRSKLVDWKDYASIDIKIDQARLHKDYPTLWKELGGKETEGIVVYDPKKVKA